MRIQNLCLKLTFSVFKNDLFLRVLEVFLSKKPFDLNHGITGIICDILRESRNIQLISYPVTCSIHKKISCCANRIRFSYANRVKNSQIYRKLSHTGFVKNPFSVVSDVLDSFYCYQTPRNLIKSDLFRCKILCIFSTHKLFIGNDWLAFSQVLNKLNEYLS
jgi:hypothetical protein